jgi:hypothetical protein
MVLKTSLVPPPSCEISGLRTGNNSHKGEADEGHGIEVSSRAQGEASSATDEGREAPQAEPLACDSGASC